MKKIFILLLLNCFIGPSRAQVSLEKLKDAERNNVILNNAGSAIPVKDLRDLKIASLDFNYPSSAVFDSIAGKYWTVKSIVADTARSSRAFGLLHDKLRLYNLIVLKLSDKTDFSPALTGFINDLESQNNLIVILSGNGSGLAKLGKLKAPIVWNKGSDEASASMAAQALFGGVGVNGRLEKDFGASFRKGSGYITSKIRLGYSVPEAVSLTQRLVSGIDSLAKAGIAAHSSPGSVILVAKDGQVIFNKAYGNHKYENGAVTRVDDIFDMASVTKVTATTPSVMRLYDQKKVGLDSLISRYVASTRDIDDKKDITVREALLHEAGYYPYIKFFELLKPGEMSTDSSAAFPVKVADGYFLRANYFNDVMWPVTLKSHGGTRGKFVYSDISMYMLKEVVEQASHRRLNEYVLNEFYLPLGMQATGFLPRNRFDRSRIVPTTENDNWFRDMLVQGYVNDPGAAMAGGVEGHAGLFSTANDLAIYYQMLLNRGSYGGQKYFEPATVDLFTSRQSKVSTRGLGFARLSEAEEKANKPYPTQKAYGHSGYTGTYVWVDPEFNLVYICLTNRVYPDDNKTFGVSKVNLRARALDLVYEEIIRSKQK